MAGLIPQEFIDDLVARVDIVELIDELVHLKKAGREYKACCPFHDEKTPSFTVSADKQFYHCFGCGAHGTAIGFLMEYSHLDFVEAVEELASRAGMDVPRGEDAPLSRGPSSAPLYAILEQALGFFRQQLARHPAAPEASSYLQNRELDATVLERFEIGYAPPGWNNLQRLLGKGLEARQQLLDAGLTTEGSRNEPYDRFRDRVIFPIRDRRGRVVGFGGRVLKDETPKYLNSPETPVFHKGRELYGLYQALQIQGHWPRLVVVEGYTDVLALAARGIDYAVATLGTAVTEEHLKPLFRLADEVVFCFDGDRAGQKAAWRTVEVALPALRDGCQAAFVFLPEGEDPDSLIRRLGPEDFAQRVAAATGLTEFLFSHLQEQVDLSSLDGRARLAGLARPLVEKIPPGALRQLVIKRLGSLTGLESPEVDQLVGRPHSSSRMSRPPLSSTTERQRPSLVRSAIQLLIHHPDVVANTTIPDGLHKLELAGVPLLLELLALLANKPSLSTAGILEHFRERPEGRHLTQLATVVPPVLSPEGLVQELQDILVRLVRKLDEQRYRYLSQKCGEATLNEAEKEEYRRLCSTIPIGTSAE